MTKIIRKDRILKTKEYLLRAEDWLKFLQNQGVDSAYIEHSGDIYTRERLLFDILRCKKRIRDYIFQERINKVCRILQKYTHLYNKRNKL